MLYYSLDLYKMIQCLQKVCNNTYFTHIWIYVIQESLVHLYRKWDSVDPDAWCKILYLEKDKVVQKFYILEREVTIDGKVGSEFDGER